MRASLPLSRSRQRWICSRLFIFDLEEVDDYANRENEADRDVDVESDDCLSCLRALGRGQRRRNHLLSAPIRRVQPRDRCGCPKTLHTVMRPADIRGGGRRRVVSLDLGISVSARWGVAVREQPAPDCPRLRSAFGPRTGRAAPSSSAASRASGRSASIPSVDHADALGHESPGQQTCAEFGLPPRSVTSGRSWRVSSTIAPGRHDLVRGAPEAGVGESSGVPVLVGRGRRLALIRQEAPAARVSVVSHRSRMRWSMSASPIGIATSIWRLALTSGESRTASTRCSRVQAGTWPASTLRDARAASSATLMSADATRRPSSP